MGNAEIVRSTGITAALRDTGRGRGDHRLLVNVAVPHNLSDEQRALLEQFERSADEETYRKDEGFFEKLKSAFR